MEQPAIENTNLGASVSKDGAMQTASPQTNQLLPWIIGCIVVLIVVVIAVVAIILSSGRDDKNSSNNGALNPGYTNAADPDLITLDPNAIPLIKSMPADLSLMPITNEKFGEYDRPYFDYGFQVEASSAAPARKNPQPTFILPMGTKVRALIDGVVVGVPKLYSNDYSIHMATDENSQYIIETEHVINPLVKTGDKVKAGDIIAEVSDYDAHNYSGYGLVEIGILKGGNPPSHICPFLYLDSSIKDQTETALREFYQKWNTFKGKQTYDTSLQTPGCLIIEEVEG